MEGFFQFLIDCLGYSSLSLMLVALVVGALFRVTLFYVSWCEYTFSCEFEKRVHKHLATSKQVDRDTPFSQSVEKILKKTHHEHYELKRQHRRRRFDTFTTLTDQLFQIRAGTNQLIQDILENTQLLKRNSEFPPKFSLIVQSILQSNRHFNRIFYMFSRETLNGILSALPGILLAGGVLGGLLVTMKNFSQFSAADGSEVLSFYAFLQQTSFFMKAVSVGILSFVIMTLFNKIFSSEARLSELSVRLTSALEYLWNDTGVEGIMYQPASDQRRAPIRIELKESINDEGSLLPRESPLELDMDQTQEPLTVEQQAGLPDFVMEMSVDSDFQRKRLGADSIFLGGSGNLNEHSPEASRVYHRLNEISELTKGLNEKREDGSISEEAYADGIEKLNRERGKLQEELQRKIQRGQLGKVA